MYALSKKYCIFFLFFRFSHSFVPSLVGHFRKARCKFAARFLRNEITQMSITHCRFVAFPYDSIKLRRATTISEQRVSRGSQGHVRSRDVNHVHGRPRPPRLVSVIEQVVLSEVHDEIFLRR